MVPGDLEEQSFQLRGLNLDAGQPGQTLDYRLVALRSDSRRERLPMDHIICHRMHAAGSENPVSLKGNGRMSHKNRLGPQTRQTSLFLR